MFLSLWCESFCHMFQLPFFRVQIVLYVHVPLKFNQLTFQYCTICRACFGPVLALHFVHKEIGKNRQVWPKRGRSEFPIPRWPFKRCWIIWLTKRIAYWASVWSSVWHQTEQTRPIWTTGQLEASREKVGEFGRTGPISFSKVNLLLAFSRLECTI